ncbi:acid protease [Rhizopogon vinicolor AM-OR11-026]|uniref:Acid protease n=1 Tax=Rhizopogon vinicolor AM-OR11-026 TaxID=1314800 RepID=A0A1B7N5G8_9AGAM|nr:acid protease [Rhizopogon vinicolor AM-OR11-026]
MLPFASSFTTLLLALSIAATPLEVRNSPITLPIARSLNVSGGTINLLQHDQARAAAFRGRPASGIRRQSDNTSAINMGLSYTVKVGVGSPVTTYNLMVDTGSSNTWVGSGTAYVKTSTSYDTGEPVAVGYGSGSFEGTEYTDTITIGTGLTITQQSIGVANTSSGFTGVDGIVGIGPVDLTEGTLTKEESTTIPTVTENLYTQGLISEIVVGISFEPTNAEAITNGELTFGGTDATKYTGTIAYTPLTTTPLASTFWGISESITYGSTIIMSEITGIVDTATTFTLIPSYAYVAYKSATSSTLDQPTGLLRITTAQYHAMYDLNFNIGSNTYALTPNGQIWPRSLNTYIGGSSRSIYLVVNDIGSPGAAGPDFINGYTFLERFYSVFDTTHSRVGFATTLYTNATTN